MPRRYISAASHGVQGHDLVLWWDATQFADGSEPGRIATATSPARAI